MSESIIKAIADVAKHERSETDRKLATLKREIKSDLTAVIARDWSGELIKSWREQKNYKPGDLVRFKSGVWQAWTDTDASPDATESGWVCLSNSVDSVEFERLSYRERKFTVKFSDGQVKEFTWSDPVPEHRGTWSAEEAYEYADEVAWGGCMWRSMASENTDEPGTSNKWQMAAQRGKPGKVGPMGEKGEQGEKGEAGLPGKDADPVTTARILLREMTSALKEKIDAE